MDPITTAIVAALAADLSKSVIQASYKALKSALEKKTGSSSDLLDSIDQLEKSPNREDRQSTVGVEVGIAKVNDDPNLVKLAEDLLNQIKDQPSGEQIINKIMNAGNAYATGDGATAMGNLNIKNNSGSIGGTNIKK